MAKARTAVVTRVSLCIKNASTFVKLGQLQSCAVRLSKIENASLRANNLDRVLLGSDKARLGSSREVCILFEPYHFCFQLREP